MRTAWLITGAVLLLPSILAGQGRDSMAVTTEELGARLRYLSSDLLEGRGTGTRGESLTTAYLQSELEAMGVRPGAGGEWLHPLPVLTHGPVPDFPVEIRLNGRVASALRHGREIRLQNLGEGAEISAGGKLVFVGYGIHAPMYGWDDFAGVDLRGKVAVGMEGEPEIPGDSVRFNGFRASRFSASQDKLAELGRRGAVGVLWIRAAGSLREGAPTGQRRLAGRVAGVSRFAGTITDAAFSRLLPTDLTLRSLKANASRSGWRAMELGVRLDVRFRTRPATLTSHNVVGVVRGTDARLSAEHVVLSAHWDGFGIGAAAGRDSIYNGALDNASGVSGLLALARVFARHPQRRSITFVFTAAEEWGLLGAEAFVCGGPIPASQVVANLNVDDGPELFGVKRDVAPLGIELSTLGEVVRQVAARSGLRVTPDPSPAEGFFFRSDNYPFARAGVPTLSMAMGLDAEGRPAGWARKRLDQYMNHQYHGPEDEYDNVVVDLRGASQFAGFIRDVTIVVANAAGRPQWLPGAEFNRVIASPRGARSEHCAW